MPNLHSNAKRKYWIKPVSTRLDKSPLYVPINFESDSLKDALLGAGFNGDRKTLFIWEGVTYYLTAEAVDATLNFIRLNSPAGSSVCFDYASISTEAFNDRGVKKIRQRMKSRYSSEPTKFGIKQGKLDSFLSGRGYSIIDRLTSKDMERRYLTLHDGSLLGKVPPLFCLVQAEVSHRMR
jgi:methyltransferase (TIGR00027 family)